MVEIGLGLKLKINWNLHNSLFIKYQLIGTDGAVEGGGTVELLALFVS